MTEHPLRDATVGVRQREHRFPLPTRWGAGPRAAAAGTTWALDAQNRLRAEPRRDGGWGGMGDYHVAETARAWCRRWMACGVWAAGPLLAGWLANRSAMRPATLHAEPQGQAETVCGRAYCWAIQVRPRIRPGHERTFSPPRARFARAPLTHWQALLRAPIAWALIATPRPALLRVALAMSQGRLRASTLLRQLSPSRRKHTRSGAFCARGRVVRTLCLLPLLSDEALRRTIHAATTSVEAWHGFVPGMAVGGAGGIRQHQRAEQRPLIRDHPLGAHGGVLHNVVHRPRVLPALLDDGSPVPPAILERLSPYKSEPINRFGPYARRCDPVPRPIVEALRFSPALTVQEGEAS